MKLSIIALTLLSSGSLLLAQQGAGQTGAGAGQSSGGQTGAAGATVPGQTATGQTGVRPSLAQPGVGQSVGQPIGSSVGQGVGQGVGGRIGQSTGQTGVGTQGTAVGTRVDRQAIGGIRGTPDQLQSQQGIGTGTSVREGVRSGTFQPGLETEQPFRGETEALQIPAQTVPNIEDPTQQTPGATFPRPVVSPLTNTAPRALRDTLPPPVRGPVIQDPSGVTPGQPSPDQEQPIQQGIRQGTGVAPQQGLNTPQAFNQQNEALSRQLQSATGVTGTTQMAFPEENAMVTVVSQDGNLTLRGTVSTEQQRQNIENAMRGISRGTFIDNQIQVTPGFESDLNQKNTGRGAQ